MSKFFDNALEDLNDIFFEDFAKECIVNGKTMPVIFDSAELTQRKLTFKGEGVYNADELIFIRKSDYGKGLPKVGSTISIGGNYSKVEQAEEQDGMYVLTLKRVRA